MIEIHKKVTADGAVTIAPPMAAFRKEADPTVGIRMLVTPEIATDWLETRGDNRKVMQTVIDQYAQDMKEGRWVFNGAPIQFDEHGKLLNGQHRLWAIIESGCSIEAVVQWGIPRISQATIDAGAKWMAKDVLYMAGEKNTSLLQATLKWIYKDETGQILSQRGMTNSKSLEILARHPNVRRSVEFIATVKGPLYASIAAFLHYKISAADPDKADVFFKRLADGLELTETSPIYRLRERLGTGWKNRSERILHVDAMALSILAWNAYRAGRPMNYLGWRKNGPAAQPFPTIDGAALGSIKISRPRGAKKPKEKPEPGSRREVATGGLAQHSRR